MCRKDSELPSLECGRFREFLDVFPGTTYALLEQTVQRLMAAQGLGLTGSSATIRVCYGRR